MTSAAHAAKHRPFRGDASLRAMSDPLVLIPARLAATRLPNKPLADIAGEPMIVHVWRRAVEAGIGPVVVATDAPEIAAVIEAAGGIATMTRPDHASGSDRLAEAVTEIDPEGRHDVIVNVQGDLPTIAPGIIAAALTPLSDPSVDIVTLCAPITDPEEADNPNVVKLVGHHVADSRLHALYFSRSRAPWGEGPLFHHIGLYAYRRRALLRFVALPQGELERREKLEQLRALEAGMRIDAVIVDDLPLGVDTPEDLERARFVMSKRRLN